MPNVLITPHTAGETSLYEKRLVDIMVENLRRWEHGEPFIHRIV
jgi:phosphoglycerate dehydrogenase-like enzyme